MDRTSAGTRPKVRVTLTMYVQTAADRLHLLAALPATLPATVEVLPTMQPEPYSPLNEKEENHKHFRVVTDLEDADFEDF